MERSDVRPFSLMSIGAKWAVCMMTVSFLVFSFGCAKGEVDEVNFVQGEFVGLPSESQPTTEEVEQLVERLAANWTIDGQNEIDRKLRSSGWTGIEVLSRHVDDARDSWPTHGASAWSAEDFKRYYTVGYICEYYLYQLLSTPGDEQYKKKGVVMPYHVKDWPAWVKGHRGRSIEEVRKMVLDYNKAHTIP